MVSVMSRTPKKLFDLFNAPSLSLQERLFRLMMSTGLMALGTGIISGLISGEDASSTLTLTVAFLIFGLITYIAIRFHRIQFGAIVTGVLILFVVMPFNFFTTGGIYGGASSWFLLGIVYVCLLIEKRIKVVLLLCGIALDAACYYFAFYNPQYVCRGLLAKETLREFAEKPAEERLKESIGPKDSPA